MKLLLDQGIPRSAAGLLRQAGHDALHTAEIGMSDSDDGDILIRARSESRTVVTLDADFHAQLAVSVAKKPSVIRIRIEGLRAAPLVTLLEAVIAQAGSELESGAVVSVQENRIRIRRLPLRPAG